MVGLIVYIALKDADFVTTQFRVSLLDARVKDERIPLSHGILGQETNGAGGMLKAFRTIPIIGQIIEDINYSLLKQRVCPKHGGCTNDIISPTV